MRVRSNCAIVPSAAVTSRPVTPDASMLPPIGISEIPTSPIRLATRLNAADCDRGDGTAGTLLPPADIVHEQCPLNYDILNLSPRADADVDDIQTESPGSSGRAERCRGSRSRRRA